MKSQNKFLLGLTSAFGLIISGCEKTDRSFSLLDSGSTYQQAGNYEVRKVDILWVIDNSGSMDSSQRNLTANFSSFISDFQAKGFDFHMAVTGTDAWRSRTMALTADGMSNASVLRRARPGRINYTNPFNYATNSGYSVLDSLTPNLSNIFVTNATQGTTGTGDERAFESIRAFLDAPENSSFRRADAFLSVIIVSDEDDFSGYTSQNPTRSSYPIFADYGDESPNNLTSEHPITLVEPSNHDTSDIYYLYNDSRLDSVDSYKTYLDGKFISTDNYSVNVIGILDAQCRHDLNQSYVGRRIGRRMMQLANLTNGVKASLCGDFATSLDQIAKATLKLTTKFKLTREPVVETISIIVDGQSIAQNETNGWSYNSADWSITFNGSSVPPQGAVVQINFTPVRAAN